MSFKVISEQCPCKRHLLRNILSYLKDFFYHSSYYIALFWTGTSSTAAITYKSKDEVKDGNNIISSESFSPHYAGDLHFRTYSDWEWSHKDNMKAEKGEDSVGANFKLYFFLLFFWSQKVVTFLLISDFFLSDLKKGLAIIHEILSGKAYFCQFSWPTESVCLHSFFKAKSRKVSRFYRFQFSDWF